MTATSWRQLVLIFVATVALVSAPTAAFLVKHDGDVSALLRIGERSAARSFVEKDIDDPVLVPDFGHDGQQFYVIARTIPNLQEAEGHVDRLHYRARRILFPLTAAPFPPGRPTAWAMLAVNLVAAGMAAVGLGGLAARHRLSPWLGLAAALSPALLISAHASLADALGFALALWGVVVWRRHIGWAVALFALAALAREQMLVAPAACALAGLAERRGRQRAGLWPLGLPVAVYIVWSLVVARWLNSTNPRESGPIADAFRLFDFPFQAWLDIGIRDRTVVVGAALAVGSVIAAYVLRRRVPELSMWLLADAVVVVTAAPAVSADLLNYVRVAPLAVPAIVLALAISRGQAIGARGLADARYRFP